jgi:DNA processing protein
MNTIHKLPKEKYPYLLKQISALPEFMEIRGVLPGDDYKFLCVIGSRNPSTYGKEVCKKLIRGLQGHRIVIVSGLAHGIDSLAHEEALAAKLKAVAFPGSGLADAVIYPSTYRRLAERIVDDGGALISAFKTDQTGTEWTFPARNRLMAGISHATLIIEGKEKSGTLITAKCAGDFNRDLLVVPGPIFSELSYGPNHLLREGATAVTCSEDILEALGFDVDREHAAQLSFSLSELSLSPEERQIMEHLRVEPLSSTDLIERTGLRSHVFNIKISELELRGLIHENNGRYRFGPH